MSKISLTCRIQLQPQDLQLIKNTYLIVKDSVKFLPQIRTIHSTFNVRNYLSILDDIQAVLIVAESNKLSIDILTLKLIIDHLTFVLNDVIVSINSASVALYEAINDCRFNLSMIMYELSQPSVN